MDPAIRFLEYVLRSSIRQDTSTFSCRKKTHAFFPLLIFTVIPEN